jgi:5-methylcytosine-specific restriction protein A
MATNRLVPKDRKRSPILSEKPETEKWLNNHPNAKIIFDEVVKIILERYTRKHHDNGDYVHGYVNYEPQYRFNFRGKGEGTVTIIAEVQHIRVRFKNKEGKVTEVFAITDATKQSKLKEITEFLDTHGNEYLGFSNNSGINTTPTADRDELEKRVAALLDDPNLEKPEGVKKPERKEQTLSVYKRDPKVVAWIIKNAQGKCECCGDDGFIKNDESIFLEVHHLRLLAENGSDTTQNAIALCANCHRKLHYAKNKEEMRESLIKKIDRLQKE